MLQISLELVALDKIVAASSVGGKWLPIRGKIIDCNRESSIQNQPIGNKSRLSEGYRIKPDMIRYLFNAIFYNK